MKPIQPDELYVRLCEMRGIKPDAKAAFSRKEIRERHNTMEEKLELKRIEDEYAYQTKADVP